MKLSAELLGLALLTVAVVAVVKGPLLQRWELMQSLEAQRSKFLPTRSQAEVDYEQGLLAARIAHAEKRLSRLQSPLPHEPMSLFELLGARSQAQGCELLQWTEVSRGHWHAQLRGSTVGLTQTLFQIETAMPALNIQSLGLVYADKALVLKILVGFDSQPTHATQGGTP